MTQDQYGQARGPGYVVRGDVVRGDVSDDDTQEFPSEQERPVTRFQKVASTLRGSGPEWNEPATPAGDCLLYTSPSPRDS